MKSLRRHLSYANVISTICLFLLLGGGAAFAATQLPKNSVGAKQIKKNSIPGNRIKNGTLTGTQIDASSIGKVPSAVKADTATKADSATTAGTATNATHATSADNANTVAGFGPSDLVHTAYASTTSAIALTGTSSTLLSVQIAAPKAGFLIVTSNGTFDQSGENSLIHTGLDVDATGTGPWPGENPSSQSISMGKNTFASASPNRRFQVAAGTHTVRLQAHNDGTGTLEFAGGSLTVTYVPF